MAISVGDTAFLCILTCSTLGLSVVLSFYLLMWCRCCCVSDDEVDDGSVRRGDGEAPPQPERKGIPLDSKPPRLTPEQQLLRDKALEKYKRRLAREERRRARQAVRERRAANRREGDDDEEDCYNHNGMGDSDAEDGRSSVTSRATRTSAATTVRTASTAAYGRGTYMTPPPHFCGVEKDDDDDDNADARSRSSRRSSGTTKSRASQGTVATIKSYMRHRQRQRLRRREEQQQIELFNQWAEAQMASSSELSPSSKSSAVPSVHSDHDGDDEQGGTHGGRKSSAVHGSGRAGGTGASAAVGSGNANRRPPNGLENDFSNIYNAPYIGSKGLEYWKPQLPPPLQLQQQRRSSSSNNSVASSEPRPPETILGNDHVHYSFLIDANEEGGDSGIYRAQEHLQASYPATPDAFAVHADVAPRAGRGRIGNELCGEEEAAVEVEVSHTYAPSTTSVHVDPQQVSSSSHLPPPPPATAPRRTKRRWKDVEHSVALSGFFNTPANNSFGGMDAHYDGGEAPAPFRYTPQEPSHSPLAPPHKPRE